MKEGWTYKKLGEVCDTLNGLWKGKKPPFVNVGVIRNANFTKDFTLRFDNVEYLDVEEKQYAKRKLQKGDLIIEKSGGSEKQPVGRAVLFEKENGEFSFSNFTSVLRIKNREEFLSEFLFIYLYFIYRRGDTLQMQKATTGIHNIEFDKYLNIGIPYISLAEQRSIVARLDAAFAGIDALKANAERQFDEAVIFYRNALSEVMTPPKGWSRKLLKEIATIRIGPFGSLIHKKDHVPGCIPLVNPIHMKDGKIQREVYFTISEEKAEELSAYKLKTGDIVVARRGEIGRCAIVTNEEDGFICGTGSMIVRFNNPQRINSRFMLRLFQSPAVREYLVENAVGATMQNINAEIVSNLPIAFPSYDEQTRIVTYLDKLATTIDDFGEIQRKTLAECDALKQAMLKEVFE